MCGPARTAGPTHDLPMIHSVLVVVRSTEAILLSRFYDGVERSSALVQAQWIQAVRDATITRWALAHEGGGEQVCMCQDKFVLFSGTGNLLFFVSGSDEYDELALLDVVQSLLDCLRGALLAKASDALTETLITEHYHVACLVLDEMINQGVLEHTEPQVVRKFLKLKLKKDDLDKPFGLH